MRSSYLSVAPILCAFLAIGATATDFVPGYEIFVPEWEVETSSGETKIVKGTIQEAVPELAPRFDEEDVEDVDLEVRSEEPGMSLNKRVSFSGSKVKCGKVSPIMGETFVKQGISYLRKVKGKPSAHAAPNACARVSCSYGAGIWWCNESKKKKTLGSFGAIADGAQHILNKCGVSKGGTRGGQAYHPTGWSVIVKYQRC